MDLTSVTLLANTAFFLSFIMIITTVYEVGSISLFDYRDNRTVSVVSNDNWRSSWRRNLPRSESRWASWNSSNVLIVATLNVTVKMPIAYFLTGGLICLSGASNQICLPKPSSNYTQWMAKWRVSSLIPLLQTSLSVLGALLIAEKMKPVFKHLKSRDDWELYIIFDAAHIIVFWGRNS